MGELRDRRAPTREGLRCNRCRLQFAKGGGGVQPAPSREGLRGDKVCQEDVGEPTKQGESHESPRSFSGGEMQGLLNFMIVGHCC